ncbi:MAG TPA: sn-glycerol-1-phosphate dehydrogenase [Spirochaetia bacterium]|nr:sn-glycerol-1-phosphate dehydrogenase [Spirochaetia bacterium]
MKNLLELVEPDGCTPGDPKDLQIAEILVGREVIEELPALLRRLSAGGKWRSGPIAVVCDGNTRAAAGRQLEAALSAGGHHYSVCELAAAHDSAPEIHADERMIGAALLAIPPETSLLISLGSGTITDIVRYVAFRLKTPFVAVATAPSVDGFTSSVAPILIGGLKTTVETAPPVAVLADPRILAQAPERLLAAGIGDMAGKLTARLDWIISSFINDEPDCEYISELVAGYVTRALEMDGRQAASEEGARDLFEGLVVSGLGITLVGSSRPASGAEHHISHFLEMQSVRGNGPSLYHGEGVAVGTYIVASLYHRFVSRSFAEIESAVAAMREADGARRSAEVAEERVELLRRLFGSSASTLEERYLATRPNVARRQLVLSRAKSSWSGITHAVAVHLPPPDRLAQSFRRTGVRFHPGEMAISRDLLHAAVLCAKEVRPRYSLLTLLDEMGMLESEAEAVLDAVYRPA